MYIVYVYVCYDREYTRRIAWEKVFFNACGDDGLVYYGRDKLSVDRENRGRRWW